MDNMKLWNSVCETNPGDTKKVEFGRKFIAIDAYSQIKKATELWGPYGKWGLTHVHHTPIEGTTMMLVEGQFKHPEGEFPVSSSIDYKPPSKSFPGGKIDDEFAKKVETDLITKALSRLGFNADVFMGKFDDNRYVQAMTKKFEQMDTKPIDMERVQKAAEFFKKVIDKDDIDKGAPIIQEKWKLLSNDERMAVDSLLTDKAPDCNKMYKSLRSEYQTHVLP